MLVFKNMFSFVLTFYAYHWLLLNGIRPAFLAISSIQMGVCALSIPMCRCFLLLPLLARGGTNVFLDIFGKWNRSFFSRHDILKLLHLR